MIVSRHRARHLSRGRCCRLSAVDRFCVSADFQQSLCEAATSPITLAECLVHPLQQRDAALVQRFRQVLTADVHTRYTSLDAAAESAAELRVRYNLSLTDAFQIAAALAAGCDAFLTNDLGLKRVRELTILVLDELEI